jgi:hypothetical protein
MSDRGPGPAPFRRPGWVVPVAIVGAVLIIIGIVLTIDWSGDDEPPVPITGTTTTLAAPGTVNGG